MQSKWILYSPQDEEIGIFDSKREAARYINENIKNISIKRFSDKGKAYDYCVIEKEVQRLKYRGENMSTPCSATLFLVDIHSSEARNKRYSPKLKGYRP